MNEQQLKYLFMALNSCVLNINEKGVYVIDRLHAIILKKGGETSIEDVTEIQEEARIKFDKKEDCDA